nr:hypothetical protein Iba_chr04cCG13960 [Ipomoea batatas]
MQAVRRSGVRIHHAGLLTIPGTSRCSKKFSARNTCSSRRGRIAFRRRLWSSENGEIWGVLADEVLLDLMHELDGASEILGRRRSSKIGMPVFVCTYGQSRNLRFGRSRDRRYWSAMDLDRVTAASARRSQYAPRIWVFLNCKFVILLNLRGNPKFMAERR